MIKPSDFLNHRTLPLLLHKPEVEFSAIRLQIGSHFVL